MNSLTNLLLAALNLFLAASLRRLFRRSRRNPVRLWAFGFFCAALAAAFGAAYHGPAPARMLGFLWNGVIFCSGLATAFMLSGGYAAQVNPLDRRGMWMMAGVALSLAGLAVQQSGWALHRCFDHNDLYHLIQGAALYLIYRGARLC